MKKLSIIIVLAVIMTISLTGCFYPFGMCIGGEGKVVNDTLSISDFNAIESDGCFNVVIDYDSVQSVVAVGNQNIIDRLQTYVHNDTWNIKLEPGNYCDYELTIYITLPELKSATINGSGSIQVGSFFNQDYADFKINGSGSIDIDTIQARDIELTIAGSGDINSFIDCATLTSNIYGSGNTRTKGWADDQSITIDASGNYKGSDCISKNSTVKILGSGSAYVDVSNNLDVRIDGSGSVYYLGNPHMNVIINGSGRIISGK